MENVHTILLNKKAVGVFNLIFGVLSQTHDLSVLKKSLHDVKFAKIKTADLVSCYSFYEFSNLKKLM